MPDRKVVMMKKKLKKKKKLEKFGGLETLEQALKDDPHFDPMVYTKRRPKDIWLNLVPRDAYPIGIYGKTRR